MNTLFLLSLLACPAPPSAEPDVPDTNPADTDADTHDTDADTDTDVVPATCDVEETAPADVPTDPACAGEIGAPADPWQARLEQRLVSGAPRSTPMLGDVDGDGLSEIVGVDRFAGSFGSALDVWRGNGDLVVDHRDGYEPSVDPVVADLDGDGDLEILVARRGNGLGVHLVALDESGDDVWESAMTRVECAWDDIPCAVTVAQLDGDAAAEIVIEGWIFDGATGVADVALATDTSYPIRYRGAVVRDLDGDGVPDVVVGERRYAPDGTIAWSLPVGESLTAYPAPVQLDDDDEIELAIAVGDELWFVEPDGTVTAELAIPGAARFPYAGNPCTGDLDGDGILEIIVPGGETLDAFSRDGDLLWGAWMSGNDGTGWGAGVYGCSTFDFDADGADEVVFGDAFALRILDGATGDVLWYTPEYGGQCEAQAPVIADVDGDGHAEIVATSTGHLLNPDDWMGVQVYGHDGEGWPAAGTTWGVADFGEAGRFHGRLPQASGAPDLAVAVADACFVCADDGEGLLAVTIENRGAGEAHGVVLRATSSGNVLDEVEVGSLAAGRRSASFELGWNGAVDAGDPVSIEVIGGADCAPGDEAVVIAVTCD